MLEHFICFA